MADNSPLNTPVLWINKYIQNKVADKLKYGLPFFAPGPNTINQLTEQSITLTGVEYPYAGVMMTWDRLHKMRRGPFPHCKAEQVLYYIVATQEDAIENIISVNEEIFRLLDRGDESAEEVNSWCSNRTVELGTLSEPNRANNMFYFYNFKVYQLEETRDIIDFGTARTYGGNKIIIDFQYHQMPGLTNHDWAPEAKLATRLII